MGFGWQDLIPGYGAYDLLFKQPADQQKAGFDQATKTGNDGTQKLMDFYMGQQKQAEGYYKPLQNMFNSAYGTSGMQGPTYAGGKPLGSMFNGAK